MRGLTRSFFCQLLYAFIFTQLTACNSPVDPLPADAVEFSLPEMYRTYWQEVEQCSGKTGDFSAVRWYYIPGSTTLPISDNHPFGAYYPTSHKILFSDAYKNVAWIVRHEELHAIIQMPGHPLEYFSDKCGGLVNP